MNGAIQILVRDVNDLEGRVHAQYVDPVAAGNETRDGDRVMLHGTIRGPFCEQTRTLPAEFKFRDLGPKHSGLAEVVISNPCTWSPELPHLYQVDVQARRGEKIVAEYHGQLGLKRSKVRRGGMAFPG
jgi:hypothetical protein